MAEIIDDVIHLTQEIGPHPAGTEEEQQAALYLAGELQKESGFTPVIEDFQCVTNDQVPRLVCFGLALIAVIVSIVFPVAAIPCFLIVALAAVVFVLEILGKPVISRLLRTGASQNVVAKYQPSAAGGVARRRKVILVANYDSGKVLKPEQSPIAGFLPILQKATAIALIVAAVLLFFRATLFATDTGAVSSVLTMLLVICAILFVLPIVRSILHIVAPFSHSANNNASGVAVLLDVARQVGTGLVSNEEVIERGAREGNQIHGEAAAREAGAVPEGATIEYEAEMSPQESLAAAKAAIAALTGKPVADKVPVTDISSRLVKGGGLEAEDEEAISSVRFEVSDTPPVREKTSHFRTMVDDGFEDYDNTPSAQIEREQLSRQEAEEAEREAARKEQEAQRAAQQAVQEAAAAAAAATESFERPAPMSVVNGLQSAPVDKTPSWAKTAQAKARANKPEDNQPHRVGRSRYADTVAAHLTEAATGHQNTFAPQAEVVQEAAPEVEDSALASRLAALRSEIESTEAPHISHETQAALDNMEAVEELPEGTTEFAAIDAVALASDIDEAAPQTAPMGAVSRETSLVDAAPQDVQAAVTAPQAPVAAVEAAGSLAADEAADVVDEGSSLADRASAVRNATSRSARKVAGASHAFASRLKSIASQKANSTAMEDEAVNIADEVLPETQDAPEMQPSAKAVRLREVRKANDQEAVLEDAAVQQADSLEEAPAQEADTLKASAPSNATAAISPIDVSRFMNKESLEDEPLDQEDLSFDIDPMYDDSFDDAAFSRAAIDQELSAEETQRVSSERIQEAIQEASMYTPVLDELRAGDVDDQQVASPIMGMEEMLPQVPLDAPEQDSSAKRQVIVLPDVVAPHTGAIEGTKQRAPMADANEDTKAGSKTLLSNMLPRIGDAPSSDPANDEPVDRFGLDLPALGDVNQTNSAVSATGSFATVGATGSFAPVGDELVADVDPEERYIEDADDSAYDEEYTETGAFAGPGYVDMPKSRAGRLFGRFRSKKKKAAQEEMSVSEWVDVDESYNARSVGKERGDWSSFRQDEEAAEPQTNASADDGFVDIDYRETEFDNRRGWNGGAFSLSRLKKSVQRGSEDVVQPVDEMLDDEAYIEEDALVDVNPAVRIDGNMDTAEQINRELRKLQDFRHPDIDTEVWFVALGAEQYSHSGMQAFLDEHADEMKGAVIINLEALGAGSLSSIEREGVYRTYKPSSRTKRFIRQAIERSGVACRSAAITRRETPASIAMSRGVQALTIAGMAEDDTALHSADNDILENIDEEMLKDASKFVLSILKSI